MNHFDLGALRKLIAMGGPELAQELMQRFLDEAPTRLEAARQGAVEQNCHRICSDSGWLGARGLQELASRAEILAADGHLAEIPATLDELGAQIPTACQELAGLLSRLREGQEL